MLRLPRRFFACLVPLALLLGTGPSRAASADLQTFLNDAHRFAGLRSFRMQVVSLSPKGSSAREMTYVAPDKLRVEMAGTGIVVVVIGTNVWLRDPDKKWTKGKLSTGDPFAPATEIFHLVSESKSDSVQYGGTRDLGGTATHLYQLYAPARKGYYSETTRVWIGVADGFPRRIEQSNGPYGTTAIYSDWNRPLTVSGP